LNLYTYLREYRANPLPDKEMAEFSRAYFLENYIGTDN
jgi:hypothetical protein